MRSISNGAIAGCILEDLQHIVSSNGVTRDPVSHVYAQTLVTFLEGQTKLKGRIDHKKTNPNEALADLLMSFGVWYSHPVEIYTQQLVDKAATLLNTMTKEQ